MGGVFFGGYFERLKKQDYLRNMSDGGFLAEITELYHGLNMIHPFREGNGRTLRLFITLLVRNADRDINFVLCDTDMLTISIPCFFLKFAV